MVNNSISGTSLAFIVLMFLSSFGACTKLTRCSKIPIIISNFPQPEKKPYRFELHEDHAIFCRNLGKLFNLNLLHHSLYKITENITMRLPDITYRLDNASAYDYILNVVGDGNNFFINIKSERKNESSIFEQWVKFKHTSFATKSILHSFRIIDSLNIEDDCEGIVTKAYQYCPNDQTVQVLAKLIETDEGYTFIEMESPMNTLGFYGFSEMFLDSAIVFEPKKYVSDSVWRQGS